MRIVDARRTEVTKMRTADIPNGFFVDINGALWFKDSEGAVLINARGAVGKLSRISVSGPCTWTNPQPVHGTIRIERNA